MFRAALLIVSGGTATSALAFTRNLIVARAIPIADYGIAATFAIAIAIMQMVTALGLQQLLIQAKDGEDERLQAGLQGFELLRGLVSALALFLCGGLIADFMNIPETAWAFRLLSVTLILHSLVHMDIHRLNRQMRFGPQVMTNGGAMAIALIAVWPLVIIFGDYRVMLYSILLQYALITLFSHLFAERRFRIAFDPAIQKRALSFGWPIILNSALLFCVFNGDRLIVGRELGIEALSIFSMGITLTLTPTLVFSTSLQRLFLPKLSALSHREGAETEYARIAKACAESYLIIGTTLCIGTLLLGEPILMFLLGEKFEALVPLLTMFAVLQAIRVLKGAPDTVALSRGRTGNGMVGNIPRALTLPLVFLVAVQGGSMLHVIAIGIAGEVIGFLVALVVAQRKVELSLRPWALAMITSVLSIALTALASVYQYTGLTFLAGAGYIMSVLFLTELRAYGIGLILGRFKRR